jgi:hypothetical protein
VENGAQEKSWNEKHPRKFFSLQNSKPKLELELFQLLKLHSIYFSCPIKKTKLARDKTKIQE